MKKKSVIYVAFCMICCLLPFIGMAAVPTDATTENKKLAEVPELMEEGNMNVNYLEELGQYFTDHFAFRQELVLADSVINSRIFGVSNMDTVLVGQNGWLYYTDTLDDYLGRNLLSGRAVFNAANNLRQMQNYVHKMGSRFLLMVAPNKNSLYGENMPLYEKHKVSSDSNMEHLSVWLDEFEINHLDLFELFQQQDEILYYKRDSHWNNKGALLVYNAMMDAVQQPHDSYEAVSVQQREDYVGDLNSMLYPLAAVPEKNDYYNIGQQYEYKTPTKSVEEAWIQTENPQAGGSVLMYRDSFGNSLLPFTASAFGSAYFSKMVPYNLQMHLEQYGPEIVIVEKVERNLDEFACLPPILQGAQAALYSEPETVRTETTLEVSEPEENLMYWKLAGVLDSNVVQETSRVYLCLREDADYAGNGTETVYEAFTVSTDQSDNGYVLYLKKDAVASGQIQVKVVVENDGRYENVLEEIISISE